MCRIKGLVMVIAQCASVFLLNAQCPDLHNSLINPLRTKVTFSASCFGRVLRYLFVDFDLLRIVNRKT